MPQHDETRKSEPKKEPFKKDSRAVAHKILLKITNESLSLEQAWDETREVTALEQRDRALCRLLILTTLRQMGYLDFRLRQYAKKLDALPLSALMALRIGLTHLIFLHTPAHAVVNSCVNLLDGKDKVMRGLVNAVLRKCAEHEKQITDATSTWAQAIPNWLLDAWKKNYGLETMSAIAAAMLKEPMLDITVKENAEYWQNKLGAVLLPTGSLRLNHQEDITKLPGFTDGAWWVQDVAATLPVKMAGDVKDKLVYDLCAAPGGKTAQLLAAGAKVVAVDQSKERLMRLRENMQRLKMNANILCQDVMEFKPRNQADVILLDAPCSATGTLRRHPDLMINKKAADFTRLGELQYKMLCHAATLLKNGGKLIYAICSLQKEEGEEVIARFLKNNPSFQRSPITGEDLGGWNDGVTKDGDLRTLPQYLSEFGGMDGFYAARLKKTG